LKQVHTAAHHKLIRHISSLNRAEDKIFPSILDNYVHISGPSFIEEHTEHLQFVREIEHDIGDKINYDEYVQRMADENPLTTFRWSEDFYTEEFDPLDYDTETEEPEYPDDSA